VLRRTVEWKSPAEQAVRVSSTRLVSFSQRAVAAIAYEVEPVDQATRVVVQSELLANEPTPRDDQDPRAAAALRSPLRSQIFDEYHLGAILVHATAASGLTAGAAMDHVIEGPDGTRQTIEAREDLARLLVATRLEPGERLRVVKFLAYGWSGRRSPAALRDQVRASMAEARMSDWDGLVADQRAFLDAFWERADVEIEGDLDLQQAVRFALFHTLQAGARAEQRAIAAKGLTGPGYDGHAFWDTETFVLPLLTYTESNAARDALRWRQRTLPLARERARELGLKGAAFPWRTIRGEECSGYWPAGTAAFHINAAVADAAVRYQAAGDDESFAAGPGTELLIETARLWRSLGHHDSAGRFRIDGVTGPDEYSAVADNNVYTNLMAERNMREAFAAVERHPKEAARLGVDEEEAASWRDAAEAMFIPYDEDLRVHPQAESFTQHEPWDFARTAPDQYPLLLHFPYFDLYRKQVVKQADLVLALHLRGDVFTVREKERDFDYYEALTVRDSSLSACTQAVVAAEVGHVELAYDYICEAALIDLDDLQHNTRDGLHIASLAGTWMGAVAGFGGMRDHDRRLSFAPRLPEAITRLTFRLCYRERRLLVEITPSRATYTLVRGEELEIAHHGRALQLSKGRPVSRRIAPLAPRESPQQPPGRAPLRRGIRR